MQVEDSSWSGALNREWIRVSKRVRGLARSCKCQAENRGGALNFVDLVLEFGKAATYKRWF